MSQVGANAQARWVVCIDFGTAFSKAAAVREGAWDAFDPAMVRPLTVGGVSSGNPFLLESAVFVDSAHVLFGAAAMQEAGAQAAKKRQALRSFKTMLSAADFDVALSAFAPFSIDPHRMFTQRDLIVLYLAYLTRAIARAVAADPALAGASIRQRYALPAWKGGQSMHGRITALFSKAETVAARLGDALFDPAGVPLEAAQDALKQAGEPAPLELGMVFEATAAASYSLVGLKAPAAHLMVVDMGAGTTDFAALAAQGRDEIVDARVTLMQAGDMIDRILLDLLLQKAPNMKSQSEQAALWRTLMASIRDVKESLFLDGRAAITHQGKTKTIALKDLLKDRDFKAFAREMKRAFERSLSAVAARAVKDQSKEVCVVAVGGGAYAPFVQEMLRQAKAPKVRVVSYPATPDWAHAAAFGGNLAPIFPQLAIAIGGALAPDSLRAA